MRGVGLTAAAAAVLLLVAGCAEPREAGGGLTLAQTKSSSQLLRNSAVAKIGNGLRSEVAYSFGDTSPCAPEEEDPKGLMREWHSTTTAGIKPEYLGQVDSIIDSVAATYTSEGWKAEQVEGVLRLTSSLTSTTLELSVAPNAGGIFIEAIGPCVKTDGPKSAEVQMLEGEN